MQGDRVNEKSSRPSESASSDVPEPVDDCRNSRRPSGGRDPHTPSPPWVRPQCLVGRSPCHHRSRKQQQQAVCGRGENPQTGYAPSAAAATGPAWSSESHIAAVSPVASSSLQLVDMVPEKTRKDIQTGKDINLATLLLPARERASHMAAPLEIKIGDETL